MSKWDTERMCRVNGKKPTARDKWIAFYRLYRISQGHGPYSDMDATDCFRILFSDWRPIQLIEASESLVTRNHVPTFLRRRFLESDKKQRLYQGHFDWMYRDKIVARQMCQQGVEVTPIEVAEVRRKLINFARQKAAADDIRLPEDDDDLLNWLTQKEDMT